MNFAAFLGDFAALAACRAASLPRCGRRVRRIWHFGEGWIMEDGRTTVACSMAFWVPFLQAWGNFGDWEPRAPCPGALHLRLRVINNIQAQLRATQHKMERGAMAQHKSGSMRTLFPDGNQDACVICFLVVRLGQDGGVMRDCLSEGHGGRSHRVPACDDVHIKSKIKAGAAGTRQRLRREVSQAGYCFYRRSLVGQRGTVLDMPPDCPHTLRIVVLWR